MVHRPSNTCITAGLSSRNAMSDATKQQMFYFVALRSTYKIFITIFNRICKSIFLLF